MFKKLENKNQDECLDVKIIQKMPNIEQVNNNNRLNKNRAISQLALNDYNKKRKMSFVLAHRHHE